MTPSLNEPVWTAGTDARLDTAFARYASSPEPGDTLWAVTLGGTPEVLIGGGYRGHTPSFVTRAEAHSPRSFFDALWLLDTYHNDVRAGHLLGPSPTPSARRPDPLLDAVLAPSQGILLWRWQLENLCASFVSLRTEANAFARRLNRKEADAWDCARGFTLSSGGSFGEAIWARMVYGGVVPGHWQSAARLIAA